MLFSLVLGVLLLCSPSVVSAATRYVNGQSNGTAANPTRPFNDPLYNPNDSYRTLTAAYNAAAAGDVIEISGGVSGMSYEGPSMSVAKALTILGSSIPGFDSVVTITANPATATAFNITAANVILEKLTLSGSNLYTPLRIGTNASNTLVKKVFLADIGPGQYGMFVWGTSASVRTFENLAIISSGNAVITGMAFYDGITNITNCTINDIRGTIALVYPNATLNLTNCAITASGNYNGLTVSGTLNTHNSLINGPAFNVHAVKGGRGIWNSTNDIINGFPGYNRSKANIGIVAFSLDDLRIAEFTARANYAMSTYGVPITFYPSLTHRLSDADKVTLQNLVRQGHELGIHSRNHANLTAVNAFSVRYTGASTDVTFVISNAGTRLGVSGTNENRGPFDLTAPSYDSIGELCSFINTWANFGCSYVGRISSENYSMSLLPSNVLKDSAVTLTASDSMVPLDDDTGPNNRFFYEEITQGIQELEAAIHLDPALSSFRVKTIGFPFNESNDRVVSWIKANTNLIGARGNVNGGPQDKNWLGDVDLYDFSYNLTGELRGPDYSTLSTDERKLRYERAARNLAAYASNGYIAAFGFHDQDFTIQEFQWFLDEIVRYKDAYNLKMGTTAGAIEYVTNSGEWTNTTGSRYQNSFANGAHNLVPRETSYLVDGGADIPSRTVDILGHPIVGPPDIGAFEFQGNAIPDETAPTISLDNPSDGATVSNAIAINATASDDIAVAAVQFFIDGNYLSEDTVSPYSASWNTVGYQNGVHTISAAARDRAGNVSTVSIFVNVANIIDSTPPFVANGLPTGNLPYTTTSVALSVTTDEPAICRYGSVPGVSYDALTGNFATTDGTAHSAAVSGLSAGHTYSYYVRCQDSSANANSSDYAINFSIDSPPPDNPLAWWKFDEGSGTTATDASGNGLNATLINGPSWDTGRVGSNSVLLDGTNDYLSLADTAAVRDLPNGQMTVATWVKVTNTGANAYLIGKNAGNEAVGWYLRLDEYRRVQFVVQRATTDLYKLTAVDQAPVYASGWFHVAVTYSGGDDANNVVIYINGTPIANYAVSRNGVGAYQSDSARELRLGRSAWNGYATANFDDSRIYNRALSAQEIALLASQ